MPDARSHKVANQGGMDQAAAWYAWEPVQKDDTWLISYVDLLSILLAALVVLLGQMAAEHVPPGTQAESSITATDATPLVTTISSGRHESRSVNRPVPDVQSRETRLAELVEERFQGEVKAFRREQGVTLEIPDAILFDSARAVLRESASPVLIRLATTLQESGNALVAVEGHTDDRPVQNGEFRSNWELAAARAYAVTRFLIDQGIAAERLRAVSYADTRPAADNGTPEGRAANRRVELRIEFLPENPPANEIVTHEPNPLVEGGVANTRRDSPQRKQSFNAVLRHRGRL